MGPGRFGTLMSRGNTADGRGKPTGRDPFGCGGVFRFGESIFLLDKNPIWMTLASAPEPGDAE
jgi:hypothetical protein